MSKFLQTFSWLIIIFAFISISLVIYWFTYPYNLFYFNEETFKVQNHTVKQGGTLVYTSSYCKEKNIDVTVSRTFENDLVFLVPASIQNRPTGCHTITISVPVPKELSAGTYHLVNTFSYRPNITTRVVIVQENTEDFTVIE